MESYQKNIKRRCWKDHLMSHEDVDDDLRGIRGGHTIQKIINFDHIFQIQMESSENICRSLLFKTKSHEEDDID